MAAPGRMIVIRGRFRLKLERNISRPIRAVAEAGASPTQSMHQASVSLAPQLADTIDIATGFKARLACLHCMCSSVVTISICKDI